MPTSGTYRWGIILCKFSDQAAEPISRDAARDMIEGSGSLRDYWRAMSYGKLNVEVAYADGWITMPFALAATFRSRGDRINRCFVEYLRQLPFGQIPVSDSLIVFINGVVDSGSANSNILIDPNAIRPTFIAHEMGHCMGLDHSFDTNSGPWDVGSDNRPGAYGNSRDIMSAENFANLPSTFQSRFGTAGPGVNALTRENVGWLAPARVSTITQNLGEEFGTQMSIAALDNLASSGAGLAKITSGGSFAGAPLPQMTYTVEFRPKIGWDGGIPADAIVIHMIREGDVARIAWSPDGNQDWVPNSRFFDVARGLALSVVFVAPDKSKADIFISSGRRALLPKMSVRKTLAHKFDLKNGLRAITPRPPFPRGSVRGMLLDNPPQIAP